MLSVNAVLFDLKYSFAFSFFFVHNLRAVYATCDSTASEYLLSKCLRSFSQSNVSKYRETRQILTGKIKQQSQLYFRKSIIWIHLYTKVWNKKIGRKREIEIKKGSWNKKGGWKIYSNLIFSSEQKRRERKLEWTGKVKKKKMVVWNKSG